MAFKTDEARQAHNAYQRRRYREQRDWAISFLGGECVNCGEDDLGLLEFDHSDATLKRQSVNDVIRGWSKERLMAYFEREQIQLLCAPCHRIKSMLENGS